MAHPSRSTKAQRRPSETQFKARALALLRSEYSGRWHKTHSSSYTGAGEPDILGVYRGRAFAFELKKPGEYPSPWDGCTKLQKAVLWEYARAGAYTGVFDDLDAIKVYMEITDAAILEEAAPCRN